MGGCGSGICGISREVVEEPALVLQMLAEGVQVAMSSG